MVIRDFLIIGVRQHTTETSLRLVNADWTECSELSSFRLPAKGWVIRISTHLDGKRYVRALSIEHLALASVLRAFVEAHVGQPIAQISEFEVAENLCKPPCIAPLRPQRSP